MMDQAQLERVLRRASELAQQRARRAKTIAFDEDDLVAAASELGIDRQLVLAAYRDVQREDEKARARSGRRTVLLYLGVGAAVGLSLLGLMVWWLLPG